MFISCYNYIKSLTSLFFIYFSNNSFKNNLFEYKDNIYCVLGCFLGCYIIPNYLNFIGNVSVLTSLLFYTTIVNEMVYRNYDKSAIDMCKRRFSTIKYLTNNYLFNYHSSLDGFLYGTIYQLLGGYRFVYMLLVSIVMLLALNHILDINAKYVKKSDDELIDEIVEDANKKE